MTGLIGAVMPTYNQAQYLREALDALVGQVDQLVVVDDGSTDETPLVLAGYSHPKRRADIVCVQQPNAGTASAINRGVDELRALGDFHWLTWASSDNAHYPEWRATLLAGVDDDVGAIYSGYDARGILPAHYNYRTYEPHLLGESHACFIGPSFLIREDVWQPHEGRHAHDYANWLRVEEACWARGLRIASIDTPTCMYRTHRGQATRRRRPEDIDAPYWLAEAKKRRARLGINPPAA